MFKLPMTLRIACRTVGDLLQPHFLVIWLLFPVSIWIVTAIQYNRLDWDRVGQRPVLWNLDRVWNDRYEEHIAWVREFAQVHYNQYYKSFDPAKERAAHLVSHIKTTCTLHAKYSNYALPLVVLLITSLYLNRLFYREEIILYLIRPLDRLQIFWGRFFGLFFYFSVMILASDLVLIWGALGSDWKVAFSLQSIFFQLKISILIGLIAVPFLFSPLTGTLFRGAGTFIFSFGTLIISFLLPAEKSLTEFFNSPFTTFFYLGEKPFWYRIIFTLQELFTMPVPRIFNANEFLNEISFFWSKYDVVIFYQDKFPLFCLDNVEYWFWSFGSGFFTLLLAMMLWWRMEVR